jgi:hypothetical protein
MAAPARVETIPYLAATQVAQEPRRQELAADILDDLWRSACEMPDAPHLSKRCHDPIRHVASRMADATASDGNLIEQGS